MLPNSPNQSTAASAGGGAGVNPAPYPQEQAPDVTRGALKDPSGGDVGNDQEAAQQAEPKQGAEKKKSDSRQTGSNRNQPIQDESADNANTEFQGYQESAVIPGLIKPQPEELLIEWQAKSRPFKKHNRQFFTSVGVIGLLMALILIFAGQWLPMAVVIAVVFVIYVFNTIEPGMVVYQLTTYGIRVGDELYYWEEMGRFWFTKKYGENVLNVEIARFPNRLSILTADLKKEDMTVFLSEILLNQQPPPTTNEKIIAWLQRKFPFDLES